MPSDEQVKMVSDAIRQAFMMMEGGFTNFEKALPIMAKAALKAAEQSRQEGWRPISKIKPEGKVILFHEDYEVLPIGYWDWIEGCDENGNGGYCGWHVSEGFSCMGDGFLWESEDVMPTHFQPLPNPPIEEK